MHHLKILSLSTQHIALLNPRLAKQITSHLANPEAVYSTQVEQLLVRMTPGSDRASADVADSQAAGATTKSEKTFKDNRNTSTNSLVSLGSKGESNTMFDGEETPRLTNQATLHEDSDCEDAGLLIGTSVAAAVGSSSVLGTLTPSVSSSNLATTVSKTPVRATLTPSVAAGSVKRTEMEDGTDFDNLFASTAKKKLKTDTLVKSKSNSDLISVKYKDSKSVGEKDKGKEKNGSGVAKEKKSKEKSGTKRKSERTDDIDDIFGF